MSLIADKATLARFCKGLRGTEFVTLDTEFMREKTFWPKLCLVQLAGPDGAAAIDPQAEDMDLTPLFDLLADTATVKVLHAGRQDIEIFFQLTGKAPSPVYDTQIAAMVCGFGDQVGYEPLIARLTGHHLDKTSRFTDWSLRPLTEKQRAYALNDVTYLRDAYVSLKTRIAENGREPWVAEEMAALVEPAQYRMDPATAWMRLKPRSTNRRYLVILQTIAAWREEEAMRRDLPRARILRDEALSEIAAHPPKSQAALERVRGLSQGFARGRMGASLMGAVERGLNAPIEDAPTPTPRRELPRGRGPLVELLKVLLKFKCEHHHVAQKLVASSADLESIVGDDEADVPALKGWRRTLFGDDALLLKHGKIALATNGRAIQVVPLAAATTEEAAVAGTPGRRRRSRRKPRAASAPAKTPPCQDLTQETPAQGPPEA